MFLDSPFVASESLGKPMTRGDIDVDVSTIGNSATHHFKTILG